MKREDLDLKYLATQKSIDGKKGWETLRVFTDKEYEHLSSSQEILQFHQFNKRTKDMVIRNGKELEDYIRYYRNTKNNEDDETKVLWEANRLLLNFLASFSSYIDQSKKNMSKYYGEEKKDSWKKILSSFYDDPEHYEYRFMCKLRNFISHYGFPFDYFLKNNQGSFIFMSKSNLLTFKKWAGVKNDLQQLENEYIHIVPVLQKHRANINLIYRLMMMEYAEKLIKAIETVNKLCKETQSEFAFIEVESVEDLNDPSKMIIESFSLEPLHEALNDLKNHPKIEMKIK